jgi:hypothetical protein
MTHRNRKSAKISCYDVSNVLFWGLEASLVAWTTSMKDVQWKPKDNTLKFFPAVKFYNF